MPAFSIPFLRRAVDQRTITVPGKRAAASSWSKIAPCLRADWFRCLWLVVIGVFVRSPALQGERIWDDHYLSHDNPFIKSPLLIFEAFRHHLFLDSFSAHYRPLQNLSFFFDYFFWNTDEFGFHLTNVLLHVGSGVLLYFLLRRLFASLFRPTLANATGEQAQMQTPWIAHAAFLVALLWTVHPVHSAAVDYISGRADSLAFLFAAGGWLLFLSANEIRRRFWRISVYVAAAFCGLLALVSREIVLVWIVLFVAHLFFVERRLSPRLRISTLVCCVCLMGIYFGLRQLPQQRLTPVHEKTWRAPVRAVLMARALGDYGRLMVFPSNLHMERTVFDPIGYRSNGNWRKAVATEYLSILGLLVLTGLLFGCIKKGTGQRARIFGAGWFLAAYLPISNIVLLNATVAEHWLYLPSVGFLIFVAGCMLELPRRHWRTASILTLAVIATLGVRSYIRSTDWVTAEIFYRRTLAAGGTSTRAGLNLGQIYANRGDYAEAEKIFRKVLEIAPNYPTAQNNLASVLYNEGKSSEAEALFALIEKSAAETRKEYPRTWIGALNLARLRHGVGDHQQALSVLERARKDYPQVWELVSFEAEVLRKTDGPESALRLVEDFTRQNWWHQRAVLAVGRLYAQKGDVDLAAAALHRASWLDIHDTEALRLIVQMRLRQERFNEALKAQRRAVARQPDEPRQYLLLSDILERMGRGEEARFALAQASRLHALVLGERSAN